jgi:uncharacterized protein (TIGR02285 family)
MRNVLLSLLVILASTASTGAKDIVYWQNVNWPPFQILRGADTGKGRFDVIIKLFQDRLPQYEHRNVEMNWSRYWEDVKSGKHILNSMAIKTKERSQYTVFSNVMTFTLPHRIIMTRATIDKIGNPETVFLSDFLKENSVRGIIEQKRSYSPKLDDILKAYEESGNFQRKALEVKHILKMLLSGRIDYTIEYPFVANYLAKTIDLGREIPLGSILIGELPRYVTACIAAPKNDWGVKVISDVNRVIREIKLTDRYRQIHKMWHSDPRELKQIEKIYKELFFE